MGWIFTVCVMTGSPGPDGALPQTRAWQKPWSAPALFVVCLERGWGRTNGDRPGRSPASQVTVRGHFDDGGIYRHRPREEGGRNCFTGPAVKRSTWKYATDRGRRAAAGGRRDLITAGLRARNPRRAGNDPAGAKWRLGTHEATHRGS